MSSLWLYVSVVSDVKPAVNLIEDPLNMLNWFSLATTFNVSSAFGFCHFDYGLFVIQRTVAHQAPLSMKFSRQEYWSG